MFQTYTASGLGFSAEDLGFKDFSFSFRIFRLGCKALGLGFRIVVKGLGFGFRVRHPEFRIEGQLRRQMKRGGILGCIVLQPDPK